jgi:hypothetical protein
VTGLQFLDDVRLPRGSKECRQPVVVLNDLVRDHPGRDLSGPTNHLWYPERALPVCVLLTAEWGHTGIGPAVHVRPVVGGINHNRVVCDAELIQLVEQDSHNLVVIDHRVVVWGLPAAGLTNALGLGVGVEVHMCGVEPDEERRTHSPRLGDETTSSRARFSLKNAVVAPCITHVG